MSLVTDYQADGPATENKQSPSLLWSHNFSPNTSLVAYQLASQYVSDMAVAF